MKLFREKPTTQQAGLPVCMATTKAPTSPGPSSKVRPARCRAAGNHPHRQNRLTVTMVMIKDYERARWGQYLMARERGAGRGGGDQTGAVGARGRTREQSTVGVEAVALILIKDGSQDIKAKTPLTRMIPRHRKS